MGSVGILLFPGRSGNVAGSLGGSSHAGTVSLTGGPVRDFDLAFQLDASPCFLLPVPHVEEEMGRLYFGNVKFLLGVAFPRFRSSFDGSAGLGHPGRRIPVVGKINGRYARLKHGPMGTVRRDSLRKASEACFLSDILQVIQPDDPSSGIARASGTQRLYQAVPLECYWGATGSKGRSSLPPVRATPGMIWHRLSHRDCWTR